MKTCDGEFERAMVERIRGYWKKRTNPLFSKEGPQYPARVTEFVEVTLSGEKKPRTFRVVVSEFKR